MRAAVGQAVATAPVLALALLFGGCGGARRGGEEVPQVDLSRFDPVVRRQIEEEQTALRETILDPKSDRTLRAARWGDLGNTFHAYELMAAARHAYEQAIALAPEDPRWIYFLGQAEKSSGDDAAALRHLRRTVELDPGFVPAWVAIGEMLAFANRPAEARIAFSAALEPMPACAPALVGLGKIALDEGRPDEARRHLVAALAAQPAASSIHHHLARVAQHSGDRAEAEFRLGLAGPVQPTVADPLLARVEERRLGTHNRMTRAQRAARSGRFEEAIAEYRLAIEAEPDHARAWTNLGAALARSDRLEEAQAALERAATLDPSDPLVLFDLGTVYLRRGDPRSAATLAASLALDPRQPAALFNLATAHRRAGRFAEALGSFEALVELDPSSPTAHGGRALMLHRLGRDREARLALEEGLAAAPGAPQLEGALARLLASSPETTVRDGRRAIGLARRALQRDSSWENRRTLAMALAEAGDFEAAIGEQRRVLAEVRDSPLPSATLDELVEELDGYSARREVRRRWSALSASRIERAPRKPT